MLRQGSDGGKAFNDVPRPGQRPRPGDLLAPAPGGDPPGRLAENEEGEHRPESRMPGDDGAGPSATGYNARSRAVGRRRRSWIHDQTLRPQVRPLPGRSPRGGHRPGERFVAGRGVWAHPARACPAVRPHVRVHCGGLHRGPSAAFGVLSLIGTAVWGLRHCSSSVWGGQRMESIAHGIAFAGYGIAVPLMLAVAAFPLRRQVVRSAATSPGLPRSTCGT